MGHGNAVGEIGALEDHGENAAHHGDQQYAGDGRNLQKGHHDDEQHGQQQNGAHVGVVVHNSLGQLVGHLGVVAGAPLEGDDRVNDDGDHKAGEGGGNHGPHMVEKPRLGGAGGQIGGIGQGGELVTAAGTGEDHAGHQARVQAHGLADGHKRDAQSGHHGPRGTQGDAHDGAEDAGQGQEHSGSDALEAVVDHGGNGAAPLEGADEAAYAEDDDDGLQGLVHRVQSAGQHLFIVIAAPPANQHGHRAGDQHRNMGVLSPAEGIVGDHDRQQDHDGDQRLYFVWQTFGSFLLCFHFSSPSIANNSCEPPHIRPGLGPCGSTATFGTWIVSFPAKHGPYP